MTSAAAGQSDRVAVLTFSEFGRRVAENASLGTDHGAAAPVFLVGPVAKPGLVGAHPGFDDLDDGDLKHHTDFRRIYASLLADWLGCPPEPIIGPGFAPLPLLRKVAERRTVGLCTLGRSRRYEPDAPASGSQGRPGHPLAGALGSYEQRNREARSRPRSGRGASQGHSRPNRYHDPGGLSGR